MKSIWDANYLLIYREPSTDTNPSSPLESSNPPIIEPSIEHILKLLSILRRLMLNNTTNTNSQHQHQSMNHLSSFSCDKLNAKLIQQLQDPLCLASRSLPPWCPLLLTQYRFLFPYDTRQLYFQTTAFGVSRSIVWLQQKRDNLLTTLRGGAGAAGKGVASAVTRDDMHEFRIGRLKHERVKIPREPVTELMKAAVNALKFHASRKAILEIEFVDEEGTGLGPTLEFFSLIAAQLQNKRYQKY
jgi:E3 ubiquitin-protein ligase HECTD1